ncbi:hypothetical protein EAG_07164 [Camponotus floridanus]|uniref:Uncharacterized protein n=1 Tax=Camponotus floridanus TaxID=104421 RepID=E2ADE8_CAMFO|nr:hypothetical protein EAG_07164 [Camponotus floridanus]
MARFRRDESTAGRVGVGVATPRIAELFTTTVKARGLRLMVAICQVENNKWKDGQSDNRQGSSVNEHLQVSRDYQGLSFDATDAKERQPTSDLGG